MSYDFAVWDMPKVSSAREANSIYQQLCRNNLSAVQASPKIDAFLQELTTVYPLKNDYSREDMDSCPWICDFFVSPGHAIMTVWWSMAGKLEEFIKQLAAKHGLVYFDPLSDAVVCLNISDQDHSGRLDREIARTEYLFRDLFKTNCPLWSQVFLIENLEKYWEGGAYRIPRTALFTSSQYQACFDQLLKECTWINFCAGGIFEDSFIVSLEFPGDRKEHGFKAVWINQHGPRMMPLDNGRNENDLIIVDSSGNEMRLEWSLTDKITLI